MRWVEVTGSAVSGSSFTGWLVVPSATTFGRTVTLGDWLPNRDAVPAPPGPAARALGILADSGLRGRTVRDPDASADAATPHERIEAANRTAPLRDATRTGRDRPLSNRRVFAILPPFLDWVHFTLCLLVHPGQTRWWAGRTRNRTL